VQKFAEELRERSGLPVHLWDERLSSVAAHEILDEAGHDKRDRKHVIDQVAACSDSAWVDGSQGRGSGRELRWNRATEPELPTTAGCPIHHSFFVMNGIFARRRETAC